MRITRILAFALLVAFRAGSQDVPKAVPPKQGSHQPKPQTHAQCKFSDGKTITANYSSERVRTIAFVTDENLVTNNGMSVPAGNYMISAVTDFHDNWTLTMREQNGQSKYWELPPKSVTKLASPGEAVSVSFDERGGTCTMHWNMETSNTLITLEFTKKKADLPVLK